jgi:RNA 2',3'-cyclic 3'-phosphodiesterase
VRLFIAIDPPPAVLDDLAAFTAGLATTRAGVRVTVRSLWHVTLAFLGEVPESRLPAAVAAMDSAGRTAPVGTAVRLAGGGRFGRGPFTIVWAGVAGDLGPLRRCATRALKAARLPFDPRRFHPHLTLARPGDKVPPAEVAADVAALAGYQGPQWTIDRLGLYRSHLGPRPVYELLHTTPLAPA